MVKKIIRAFKSFFNNRIGILLIIFGAMSVVLVFRLVQLQLIDGEQYASNFTVKTTKTRKLRSSRGNIYDARGNLLAYNKLSNSVTIADNGTYETTRQKNLALNGEIFKLVQIIREHGDVLTSDFHIVVGEDGAYKFDTDNETTINRFRADVYGYRTIEELSQEEHSAGPDKIMHDLGCEDRFALFREDAPYTEEELTSNGLPLEMEKEDALAVTSIRYQLSLISFQRYMSITVANNVSAETVAAVKENSDILPGVDVEEDYVRIYNSSPALSPILGYTGRPSAEELEELQAIDDRYTSQSVIGKAGIEQSMETYLQGTDGSEEVTVDNLGRVLAEDTASKIEPVQGYDVYLTIDADLQDACYQILEQRIAGIILMYLIDMKSVNFANIEDIDTVPIPSYDVYFALINNEIIDTDHFTSENASKTEIAAQEKFEQRQSDILGWIRSVFQSDNPPVYNQFTLEQKVYFDYIFDQFLSTQHGVLNDDVIDTTDDVYQAYVTEENISPREFLSYAVYNNWIDLEKLKNLDNSYLTTDEVYVAVLDYMDEYLREDPAFSKLLYKYMLLNDILLPEEVCRILYDQGILENKTDTDEQFLLGTLTAFELITEKIKSLEITPAMLALDPCSGSIVITDPETGFVKACVTYPGYDNTRLANNMDVDYYNSVNKDLSTPFYNKATQQSVAPGSTYKPIMAAAGLNEGLIDPETQIPCYGLFGPGLVPESDYVECWLSAGHGMENVVRALGDSCNVFFCTIGYMLGLDDTGGFTLSKALAKEHRYSQYFGLDKLSGVQIPETEPQVSDSLPIPSAMGQGTHRYATVQLARYVSTIATKGRCYDLSLVEKITDSNGEIIKYFDVNQVARSNFADGVWDEIYAGMKLSVDSEQIWSNNFYKRITVYGKTGTAEQSKVRADHALSIGFTKINPEGIAEDDLEKSQPVYVTTTDENGYEVTELQEPGPIYKYENLGEIAYAIRVGNGYTSRNTNLIAMDMLYYYYGLMDNSKILLGRADSSQMVKLVREG